ncbi:transcriptional activator spt7 [Truncatella angustata]|uniref:SAGA complex subunit Spt7 n=1 Tax=Truncatella angustata TaxID=152316 RepID=A0A9P8ZWJ4_9PEZI|nr:transcriptional activator spt7 [Truncatella angustata]KAH6652023.1 transcriptional activator spt7 [Truncatella angustata]
MNGNQQWTPSSGPQVNGNRPFHFPDDGPRRTQTPIDNSQSQSQSQSQSHSQNSMPEASTSDSTDDDRQRAFFADLFRKTEANIAHIFGDDGSYNYPGIHSLRRPVALAAPLLPPTTDHAPVEERPLKRVKRVIDEDDYGDDDDDEEEDDEEDDDSQGATQLNSKAAQAHKGLLSPSKSGSSPGHSVTTPEKQADKSKEDLSQGSQASQDRNKSSEDARKKLEEDRVATEQAVKRSFHTVFYTLENDRTAMLEQQQLEESEKLLQAEMDKNNNGQSNTGATGENHGSLSSANLGASSLTLKHLIARIDMKRDMVRASDAELRHLMNEVRKNRSKWASEENVNQEELYEAVEKVLTELKAHTEYSTPFLQKVNKRDAPDYYNLIKTPMDLGTMTKKLKSTQYKSKADFVGDLNLIWDNCLRYNQDMNHPLRRMANGMRREAEKLIPLIPDLVIRPRAEVEAEERRKLNGGEDDNGDDSDDEPIMSSRGRNTTGAKGASKSRKAPSDQKEETPNVDQKPVLQLNGLLAKAHREGSELDGSNGFATPPVGGSITPGGVNGISGVGSNGDAMDIDGPSLNGMALNQALNEAQEQIFEDEEYKIYKQLTKKDRARIAMRRNQLFNGRRLNVEEPALLRTKAGMRNYLRHQQQAEALGAVSPTAESSSAAAKDASKATETLAEGMEEEEVDTLAPAYYEPQSLVPDILPNLRWSEDGDGQVINHHEDYLKTLPSGFYTAPKGALSERLDANLRQMQETRKVCSKIAVVKQMQIQAQVYTNQFPKYEPEPFTEQDIEPHVICSADNLVMDPTVNRAALQRSVAKLFYHAGFEEMQPSAMEAITDVAADYFHKLVKTFTTYAEADGVDPTPTYAQRGAHVQPRFTDEEVLLHTLHENGFSIEDLDSYAKDEVDRLGNKLGVMHDRMKNHLAELLRPALNEGITDGGASSFNEGSEQFVSGDFADELGEDYFGFKDLGLAGELGGMLSVPLHLLHSRVRTTYASQNTTSGPVDVLLFDELSPPDPVTKDNIQNEIGLAKNFFLAKLHANGDQPLVEDLDLPIKQQRPRPRLGATGKIVGAQKRPPKEQNAINKRKKKMEAAAAAAAEKGSTVNGSPEKSRDKKLPAKAGALPNGAPNSGSVATEMPHGEGMQSQGSHGQTDKTGTGMMSPESNES